jgi:hypothetical protein
MVRYWATKIRKKEEGKGRGECTSIRASVRVGRRLCVVGRIFAGGRTETCSFSSIARRVREGGELIIWL